MERGLKGLLYLPNVESKVVPKGIIVETLGLLSGRKGFFRPQDRPTQGKEGKPPWKGVLKVYFTFLIWNLRLHPKESLWIALACARDERGRKGSSNPKDRPTQGKEGKPSRKSFFKDHFTFLIWNLRLSPKESLWSALAYSRGRKGIFRPKDRATQGMEGKPSWKVVLKVHRTFLMWNLRFSPKESSWRHLACSRDESGRKGFFRPQDDPTQGKEGKPPWKGVLKV